MHVEQVIVVFLIDIKQVLIQSPLESEINSFVLCGLHEKPRTYTNHGKINLKKVKPRTYTFSNYQERSISSRMSMDP